MMIILFIFTCGESVDVAKGTGKILGNQHNAGSSSFFNMILFFNSDMNNLGIIRIPIVIAR